MPCHATPALDTDTESSSSGMSRQETNTFHKTQKEERKKGRILNTKSEFRKRGRRQLWRNNFTFFFFCEIQRFIFPKNLLLFVCLRESGTFFNCTNYYFVTKYVLPDRRHRRLKWPEQKCFATKVGGLAYNKSRNKLLQGQDISQPLTMYRERQLMSKARWSKKVNTNIYLSLNGLKWGKAINV